MLVPAPFWATVALPVRIVDIGGGRMAHAVTTLVALLIGFLAGLLTFKQKSQWCPGCGATKRCPDAACAGEAAGNQEIGRRADGERWDGPTIGNPQVGRAGRLTRGQAARTNDGRAR
jgi:hypothetical protein